VSSKTDTSQLNLAYRRKPTTKQWKTEVLKSKKTDMLRSIGKQSGEPVESVLKKKRKATATVDEFAEKSFKPGVKE